MTAKPHQSRSRSRCSTVSTPRIQKSRAEVTYGDGPASNGFQVITRGDGGASTTVIKTDELDTRYVLFALEDLRLHVFNDQAQDGTIDPELEPTARRMVRILGLTDWIPELEDEADALEEDAVALLQHHRDWRC